MGEEQAQDIVQLLLTQTCASPEGFAFPEPALSRARDSLMALDSGQALHTVLQELVSFAGYLITNKHMVQTGEQVLKLAAGLVARLETLVRTQVEQQDAAVTDLKTQIARQQESLVARGARGALAEKPAGGVSLRPQRGR